MGDTYENIGNYGGYTDTWFYYGNAFQNSGPKGEASTYGMAVPSTDYLYARLRLYDTPPGGSETLIDSDTQYDYDADDVYCFVSSLNYVVTAVATNYFEGKTKHKIQDDANSWDDIFYTDDGF